MLISAVYRISNQGNLYPYLGAGIGKFLSELTITSRTYVYLVTNNAGNRKIGKIAIVK